MRKAVCPGAGVGLQLREAGDRAPCPSFLLLYVQYGHRTVCARVRVLFNVTSTKMKRCLRSYKTSTDEMYRVKDFKRCVIGFIRKSMKQQFKQQIISAWLKSNRS